jgi:hypothetical protein
MLRQLFFSGAVAACNMEVLIATPKKRRLRGFRPLDERDQ